MHIEKLSLYIIAMNEEKRLPKVLDSVRDLVDEIVIVDSGSTDRTEEIAREYGARFIHHEWESVGHQVAFAEKQCRYKWVLRLDADEVISPGLAEEIRAIRQNGDKDAYYLKRGEMFPGYKKPNPWVKYDKIIRIYHTEAYRMSGRLGHDDVVKLKENAAAGRLKHFLYHYACLTMHQLIEKRNVQSDRQVERALKEGKNYSPWRMVGAMSVNFFKYFFLARYFLYGFWGFMFAINIGYVRFSKFSKFYEHRQLEKYGYF